jgi:hypothetical protein
LGLEVVRVPGARDRMMSAERDNEKPVEVQYAAKAAGGRDAWGMRRVGMIALLVLAGAGVVYLCMPRLAGPRGVPPRTVCWANLTGIGTALATYAAENDGYLPDNFKVLVDDGACSPMQFVCPAAKQGDPLPSYVYHPGLRDGEDATFVVAYERPGNHQPPGGNVLFLDYHAEYLKADELKAAVERTEEYLERKATERRSDEATEGEP